MFGFLFTNKHLSNLSNETKTGWLGYVEDYTGHLCGDSFINHDQDPY